jgi:hypothetical protein
MLLIFPSYLSNVLKNGLNMTRSEVSNNFLTQFLFTSFRLKCTLRSATLKDDRQEAQNTMGYFGKNVI